jgi:hypothetical protein
MSINKTIARQLATRVVRVGRYSAELAKQCNFKPSQQYVVELHEADDVHRHAVFASTRLMPAMKEASSLQKLLVDFAEECVAREYDSGNHEHMLGHRRRPVEERRWDKRGVAGRRLLHYMRTKKLAKKTKGVRQ